VAWAHAAPATRRAASRYASQPMASRIEEKKRRREEREAKEAAARAAHKRQRTMQFGGLAIAVVAVVIVGVLLASTGGGGTTSTTGVGNAQGPQAPTEAIARIPPVKDTNLTKAAAAAGCVVSHPPSEGRTHVETPVTYHTNPPTSGNHNPVPALDGVYAPGNTPTKEHYVHTLEHGRVELQYAPGQPRKVALQLQSLLAESFGNHPGGYKMLLFQNNTNMPYAVAATAWTYLIGCKKVNNNTWDALRDFRNAYIDKAPESSIIPPNDL
jgi:hypothetical protein